MKPCRCATKGPPQAVSSNGFAVGPAFGTPEAERIA